MAHVLIVDDNETLREGAASVVRKMGHQVTTAVSGDDGVARFVKSPADVVLTDWKMDNGDGLGVLTRVRDADKDAVVVIMTGFGTVKNAVDAMKAGGVARNVIMFDA